MRNKKWICTASIAGVLALTGAFAFINPTTASAATAETFKMSEGMSIRTEEPAGLRFLAQISSTEKANYEKFGMLMMPKAMGDLSTVTVTAEEVSSNANAIVVKTANWLTEDSYTGVLVGGGATEGTFANIDSKFYNVPISAMGYAITAEGEVVYTGVMTRSMTYIAKLSDLAENKEEGLLETISNAANVVFTVNDGKRMNAGAEVTPVFTIGGIEAAASQKATVTYTSNNEGVAKVVDGKIQAVAGGKATITATLSVEGGVETYTQTEEVEVVSTNAADFSLTIPNGDFSTCLNPDILAAKGYTYTDGDDTDEPVVFKKTDGNVYEGEAQIAPNGSYPLIVCDKDGNELKKITVTVVGGITARTNRGTQWHVKLTERATADYAPENGVRVFNVETANYDSFSMVFGEASTVVNAGDKITIKYYLDNYFYFARDIADIETSQYNTQHTLSVTKGAHGGENANCLIKVNGVAFENGGYLPYATYGKVYNKWMTVEVTFKESYTGTDGAYNLTFGGLKNLAIAFYDAATHGKEMKFEFACCQYEKAKEMTVSDYAATQNIACNNSFSATVTPEYLNGLGITYSDGTVTNEPVSYLYGGNPVVGKIDVQNGKSITLQLCTKEGILLGNKTLTLTATGGMAISLATINDTGATVRNGSFTQYSSLGYASPQRNSYSAFASAEGAPQFGYTFSFGYWYWGDAISYAFGDASAEVKAGDKIVVKFFVDTFYYNDRTSANQYTFSVSKGTHNGELANCSIKVNGVEATNGEYLTSATYGSCLNGWVTAEITFNEGYTGTNGAYCIALGGLNQLARDCYGETSTGLQTKMVFSFGDCQVTKAS